MKIVLKNFTYFRELLIRNGDTQTSFSKKLGITKTYMSQISNGKNLGPELANNICKKLDKQFDEIFLTLASTNDDTKQTA